MTPQERFAVNLRRARLAAGISQEKLARRCDLHRTEVSLLERGGREPRLATIVKLTDALATEPEELKQMLGIGGAKSPMGAPAGRVSLAARS